MSTLILELIGPLCTYKIVLLILILSKYNIPKEIRKFIGNKNIKTNIFRIQAYDSIMCGYFCIGFIDFVVARKALTGFTNLFSLNNLKRWS